MRRGHPSGFGHSPDRQTPLDKQNDKDLEDLSGAHGEECGKQQWIGQQHRRSTPRTALADGLPHPGPGKVNTSRRRLVPTVVLVLLTVDASAMDQAKPIIAQWSPEIQILSLSGQTAWPYSSGALPLEVSPAGDRLTSVWPRSLISLNSRGRADRDTLLALFATTTADWIAGEWSPDNGALGSDGFWRAVVPGFGPL